MVCCYPVFLDLVLEHAKHAPAASTCRAKGQPNVAGADPIITVLILIISAILATKRSRKRRRRAWFLHFIWQARNTTARPQPGPSTPEYYAIVLASIEYRVKEGTQPS